MTTVAPPPSAAPAGAGGPDPNEIEVPPGHVKLTIDGIVTTAPKGELVIRAAERLGIAIPRFCDHPLLAPVGACRQCLVEVEMGGRPMPKPQASCTQTVADGMVVKTQLSSPVAEKAQRSNLEFLLLNHPLDCPVCDKGGECPLQNQTMANGSAHSRLREPKRVFTKPITVSTQILLDRERCVLCQRCTRFSEQIAGDKFIDLLERGSMQQIGINSAEPFQSYFSGNTIQICPVGALTSAAYRFRARPFDLVSTDTVCEHCSSGCALRTDHRAGGVTRRLARTDDAVNEDWNCDKGRFAFTYVTQPDRITRPLVRDADGVLQPASWTDAIRAAAQGLARARDTGGVGVLTGGRLTVTDAYAYAKFARVALRTNDIDFRARPHSAEEAAFLAQRVAGRGLLYGETPDTDGGAAVTYAGLEKATAVLLVGLEPEEESPILFLRLRKAARKGLPVASVAALASRGLQKLDGILLAAAPGDEPSVLSGLTVENSAQAGVPDAARRNRVATALRTPGAVVLVGERAAEVPGLLTAVGALVDTTGARLAWVPRRAGERGALEVGAVGTLLPGGRPVGDRAARAEVETAWGVSIPATPGRDVTGILAAVAVPVEETDDSTGAVEPGLAGLLIGGVDLDDLPDPAAARTAVAAAGFVVSLEMRTSAVTALADVVLPVAAPAEKAGAYLDWEARVRPFAAALPQVGGLDDGRVLDTLGVEMDVDLFTQTPAAAAGELGRLGRWSGDRPALTGAPHPAAAGGSPYGGGFRLASWRMNLDGGRGLDGEPHLAGTAKALVARLSPADAAALGAVHGAPVTVTGPTGSITLPLDVTPMVDGVIWLPARIDGLATTERLGVLPGRPGDVLLAVRPAPAHDHHSEGTR